MRIAPLLQLPLRFKADILIPLNQKNYAKTFTLDSPLHSKLYKQLPINASTSLASWLGDSKLIDLNLGVNNWCRDRVIFTVTICSLDVLPIKDTLVGWCILIELVSRNSFPCSDESAAETGCTLKSLIEMFGLPASLYSNNHRVFKEILFK